MDEEEIKRQVIFGTGCGMPPQQSQFKKGQSGNPKGRPKTASEELPLKDQPTLTLIHEISNRVVPVRENGEVKHMSMREVAVNALFNRGAKGDPRALATLFALTQKADAAWALQIKERNAAWQAYKNTETAKIAQAKATGAPMPKPLPHPDDIIIDLENGPRFLGPVIEEEQVMLDHTIRLRDLLILQDALDHRSAKRLNGEPLTDPGGAELFAMVLDQRIPPRLQLSNGQWIWRVMKAEGIPKRVLLKQLYEQWRKLGYSFPRGFIFPGTSRMQRDIQTCVAITKEIQRLPAPDKMPQGQWEQAAAEIILAHFNAVL